MYRWLVGSLEFNVAFQHNTATWETSTMYRNGWTGRAGFGAHRLPSYYPTQWCYNGIRISSKIRVFPSRTLSQTLDLEIFLHSTSTVASGSTDDHRQIITLNVHICGQHSDSWDLYIQWWWWWWCEYPEIAAHFTVVRVKRLLDKRKRVTAKSALDLNEMWKLHKQPGIERIQACTR